MNKVEKALPARIQIEAILRKALFSGEYKSGDELSLTAIAAQLGISRTPVREAFQTLEAEGLIELRMNKGAIVKPIGRKYIMDHYDMRILLESEAARRAAQRGMLQADVLLDRLNALQPRIESVSNEEYEQLNLAIHAAIWTAADNERLTKFLESLWNGPSIGCEVPRLEHYCKSTQEHLKILTAIRQGDAPAAQQAMTAHIERSRDNILKGFKLDLITD